MALHVLLHGGEAGAVFQADGALVRRGSVVGAQVFDHGRVIPGALVAQLTLKRLLTCREERGHLNDFVYSDGFTVISGYRQEFSD